MCLVHFIQVKSPLFIDVFIEVTLKVVSVTSFLNPLKCVCSRYLRQFMEPRQPAGTAFVLWPSTVPAPRTQVLLESLSPKPSLLWMV